MSKKSRISYNLLAIKGLREVLVQVSSVCKDLDIDYFIVGALARNVWFATKNLPARGTRDIDIGFYVSNKEKYNQIRTLLKERYNYKESVNNAFCFIAPGGQEIDLLPFGEIEHNGKVMIEGQGLTSINLDGFMEVFSNGAEQINIGDEKYLTCSIPGIVVLKLIAYDDRPEQRMKDVKDINEICLHYPDIELEDIWEKHNDLYSRELEHADVAMIALGREMKILVKENKKLTNRIIIILENALAQESTFLTLMIDDPILETISDKIRIIKNLKKGFLEK